MLSEITFKKLYQQIIYNLKTLYNKADSSFTLASPYGHILTVLTDLYSLNTLQIQNVQRSFDLNDPLNNSDKAIRALVKIGQYDPVRGQAANGSIKIKLKAGINIAEEIKGNQLIFTNRQVIKNQNNSLSYILDLNQENVNFTISTLNPIVLNIVQGQYKTISFTGTGEINQSYVVPVETGKDIDHYRYKLYVNSELWQVKKHKFDLLPNEKSYVAYTSFSGGVDILFGNNDEGMVPPLGSIITFEYLVTDGQDGNIINPQLNDFKFIDMPKNYYGDDITVEEFFDVDVETQITFGSNGDNVDYLKSIMPYTSSNFVLAGPDQYKFFLKRLGIFSLIDVYVSNKNSTQTLIHKIYDLAKQNTDLLNKINNSDNTGTLPALIKQNLAEIVSLRKMILSDGSENLINLFLIPDIRIFYGKDTITNYFNIDFNAFILDDSEKQRILNYLSQEGLQIITNEIKIIDPVIRKYVVNVTCRVYDDAVDDNIINNIINSASEYFVQDMRRDRIPNSDLIRILDELEGIDSVNVEFVSEQNENYHKEFLIKSENFNKINNRYPNDYEITMSDGLVYDNTRSYGLDIVLGDILIEKEELPIIRGGWTDRYNNKFNETPGQGQYSSINVLILPQRTHRRQLN